MIKKIIVPTDLTKAAEMALRQAIAIALNSGSPITLFHVFTRHDDDAGDTLAKLATIAEGVRQERGIPCEVLVKEGEVLPAIASMVAEKEYDLMVIGTHGFMGIRQKLFGADILKLVSVIPIPVMVVQQESPLVESFHKLILPVSSHANFIEAVESVIEFAAIFPAEVHLYSIHKAGFEWPEQLLANITEATRMFEQKGVRMLRIREEQEGYSPGYARQTIRYARTIGADALWMMSSASAEYYSFARDYKETLLLNEFLVPVVCVGGLAGS